ncbi:MAG: potassium channel protein [Desulfobacterales bacterium]|nr:MAG: potassium channel protein [Desulfobacterales bacterium]
MSIKRRLYYILVTIFLVVIWGSTGYYILFGGKHNFMDCLYMTVISLTSVGYGEVIEITGNIPAQIFTMVLITFGMGIILYGLSTMTALIIEGELTGILRKKKMEKRISKLNGHYIVCGGGETGRHVLDELIKNKESIVLIEQDEENIERAKMISDGLLYISGDATEDQNLLTAGIERASGIIISLPSDRDNLYVTMTARMLNRKIRIISRLIDQTLELKLKTAGANKIVSPNYIGGLRMASEMIRPTAVDFLDSMLRSTQGNLRIHQVVVTANSSVAGKSILASGLKDKYNLLVLGAKHPGKEVAFNPSHQEILGPGMTLIVMGDVDNIAKAKKAFFEASH